MALLSPYWKVSQGVYCLFEYSPSKKKNSHCDYFLISIISTKNKCRTKFAISRFCADIVPESYLPLFICACHLDFCAVDLDSMHFVYLSPY